jgi:hypothetical protein
MIRYYSTTELRDVIFKINQIFTLLMSCDIIKMDIFISPFEIMNDALVCQFLFDDKNVLKEINNPFFDVKMIKFCDHCFLIF